MCLSPWGSPLSLQHLPMLPTTFLMEHCFAPLPSACGSTKPSPPTNLRPLQVQPVCGSSGTYSVEFFFFFSFFLFFLLSLAVSLLPRSCSVCLVHSEEVGAPLSPVVCLWMAKVSLIFFLLGSALFFCVCLQAFCNVWVPGLLVCPSDP